MEQERGMVKFEFEIQKQGRSRNKIEKCNNHHHINNQQAKTDKGGDRIGHFKNGKKNMR